MQGFRRLFSVVLVLVGWSAGGIAAVMAPGLNVAEVVSQKNQPVVCEKLTLPRDLNIYKDPTLFLSIQGLLYADPEQGHEAMEEETPLLTTVNGTFQYEVMGDVREFRGFGEIAKLYERAEPRFKAQAARSRSRRSRENGELYTPPMMVPIRICGDSAYNNFLGFILQADLIEAIKAVESKGGALPPSTAGNPIPKLRE